MSQSTPLLDLPLIQEAQAQKHVTHNEAVVALDALVQPVALDGDRTEAPAGPAEGDRHLVAAPATGAWAGQEGALALFSNGGWDFRTPRAGWRVHVLAEGVEHVFDGAGWAPVRPPLLGVNTSADTTNRLAVSSAATLLTHAGAGHRLKLNKAAPAETASLLFQTGFSGRAEMGLAGGDDFSVKVSADGTSFQEALAIDAASGAVRLPGGYAGTGSGAGPLGGQVLTFSAGQAAGLAPGDDLSEGAGQVLPFAGRVLGATVSVAGGAAGTTVLTLTVDGVLQTGIDIPVTYGGSGLATAVADFSSAPVVVAAGAAVVLRCTSGGGDAVVGTLFVQID